MKNFQFARWLQNAPDRQPLRNDTIKTSNGTISKIKWSFDLCSNVYFVISQNFEFFLVYRTVTPSDFDEFGKIGRIGHSIKKNEPMYLTSWDSTGKVAFLITSPVKQIICMWFGLYKVTTKNDSVYFIMKK